jgi:hypothetical protein
MEQQRWSTFRAPDSDRAFTEIKAMGIEDRDGNLVEMTPANLHRMLRGTTARRHLDWIEIEHRLAKLDGDAHLDGVFHQDASLFDQIEADRDLIALGDIGSGKTYLALAIAHEHYVRRRANVCFRSCEDFDWLTDLRWRETYNVAVLILDDFGVKSVSDTIRTELFKLAEYRSKYDVVTIVTSNYSADIFEETFGERNADRLDGPFINLTPERAPSRRRKPVKRPAQYISADDVANVWHRAEEAEQPRQWRLIRALYDSGLYETLTTNGDAHVYPEHQETFERIVAEIFDDTARTT